MTTKRLQTIAVCADDYGATPGIGIAIRDLIESGRITATSCMTVASCWPGEAERLRRTPRPVDVGLHFTLTDFPALGPLPTLAPDGRLPSLQRLILLALARTIDAGEVAAELERQVDRFQIELGRPPDFIDGHQHVHQLPIIRDAVFAVFRQRLQPAGTWLRYAAMPIADVCRHRVAVLRTLIIDVLGAGFRRQGVRFGIAGNAGFRGVRGFRETASYPSLFRRFLAGAGDGTLVMCHPALPDEAGSRSEFAAPERLEEYRFLASDAFPAMLERCGFALGRISALTASGRGFETG
jgi:hypothetical protein